MALNTRTRFRTFREDDWYEYRGDRYGQPLGGWPKSGTRRVQGRQTTTSEGHLYRLLGEAGEDIGGEFDSTTHRFGDQREDLLDPQPQYLLTDGRSNPEYKYFGPVYAANPAGFSNGVVTGYPPAIDTSIDDLDEFGTTAIARCKPTSSPANLSVGLAELVREGLPSMAGWQTWQNRSNLARGAGSEYLNVQFGWLPLVSEIKDTAAALQKWDSLVTQYERDAGRRVRRRYEFPIEKTSMVISDFVLSPTSTSLHTGEPRNLSIVYMPVTPKRKIVTRETTVRRWFSGSFSYHLPADYNSRNKMRAVAAQAVELLGLEITPEVVWNLMPWSWAVDWFTNTGDVMSVISDMASDGLVVNYGYIMEHTIVKDTHVVLGATLRGQPSRTYSTVLVTERKRRRKATPFGFGLTWDDLSPKQFAIATALGLTKLPR